MTSFMCWAREANIRASSARGERSAVAVSSSKRRIFSPVAVPPGSPSHHDRQALGADNACQLLQLRALAAAVQAFECDEPAAMRVRGHAEIINEHLAFGTWHLACTSIPAWTN